MKKIMLMACAAGLFAFTSCSSDDDGGGKSCSQLQSDYLEAFEAYSEDPSTENCQVLADITREYKEKGCEGSENAENFDCE